MDIQLKPHQLSAAQAARMIREGSLSSEELTISCLQRVGERDAEVKAWAFIDSEAALAQARQRDRESPVGPLHGVPVAIKDIYQTRDFPTECNSPIYKGHRPLEDAACVVKLRRAGALVIGKTVTAEFAHKQPGPTRNPRSLDRTPGGSSSGSAAAVADTMVPFAIGSQGGGSTIRPASYCGIFGFKPSFGRIDVTGAKTLAASLDTLGWFSRSIDDIVLVEEVLSGAVRSATSTAASIRIGFYKTPFWTQADESSHRAFDETAKLLGASGHAVEHIDLAEMFGCLEWAHHIILSTDAAFALRREYELHRSELSLHLRALIEEGLATPSREVQAARAMQTDCMLALQRVFGDYDVLLTPSAPGEAPDGIKDTGSAIFNKLWSLLYVPVINLPLWRTDGGLPIGVQLVGKYNSDIDFLKMARDIWSSIGEERPLPPPRL